MNRVQWFLNKLTQEASELIKDATKTAMFGLESYDPQDPNQTPNLQLVVEEFFDVVAVFEQFIDEVGARDKVQLLFDGNFQEAYLQHKKDKNNFYLEVCQNIGSTFNQPVEQQQQIKVVKDSHNCSKCKSCNCKGECGCNCQVGYRAEEVMPQTMSLTCKDCGSKSECGIVGAEEGDRVGVCMNCGSSLYL